MLEREGKTNADGSFNWKDALIDSSISAAITGFTSVTAGSLVGSNSSEAIIAALIASGASFFIYLGMKRGIREKPE